MAIDGGPRDSRGLVQALGGERAVPLTEQQIESRGEDNRPRRSSWAGRASYRAHPITVQAGAVSWTTYHRLNPTHHRPLTPQLVSLAVWATMAAAHHGPMSRLTPHIRGQAMSRPRQEWLYRALLLAASAVLFLFGRRRYGGVEAIPRHGAAIVVTNHISEADPLVSADAIGRSGRRPRALVKRELFNVPIVRGALRAMGHIPVDRGTATAQSALRAGVEALARGEIVMLYPEGTIGTGKDLWPGEGKSGAARLALSSGAPVIAMAQWGAHQIITPKGHGRRRHLQMFAALVRRPGVEVRFGSPFFLTGDPENPDDVRAGTVQLMSAIEALLTEIRGPKS